MKSNDLEKICDKFSKWQLLDTSCLESVPAQQGAYVIRMAGGKTFGRLRGESDILYIGKAESKGGFKRRFSFFLRPGKTQWTSKRIHEMLKRYEMEVSWCPFNEPKNLEHRLLNQYLSDHDELPPLNHAGSKTLKKILSEVVGISDKVSLIHIKGK